MLGDTLTNAAVAVQLALFYPEWVQRRVEQITFLDDRAVRLRKHVAVRWPHEEFFPAESKPADRATIYAPLGLIAKSPLVDANVRGADGDLLSTLAPAEHDALVVTGLVGAILPRLSTRQQSSTRTIDAIVGAIDAIVTSPPPLAQALCARIFDAAARPQHPLARALDEPDELHGLVNELTTSSLLLVPATYEPGVETVIEYGYVTSLSPSFSWRTVGAACGLQDHRVEIPDCQLGCCDDYQLEVIAPEEVRLARARLLATYFHVDRDRDLATPIQVDVAEDGDVPVVGLQPTRPPLKLMAAAARAPSSCDRPWKPSRRWEVNGLSAAGAVEALVTQAETWAPSPVARADNGTAELSLRPPVGGTFLAGAVVSLLTTILLVGAYLRLEQLDGASGVTLLLALPILAAGYLTRPGEHPFATRLLLGVRAAVLVVGVCSLVFAAILGSGGIERRPPPYRCTPAPAVRPNANAGLRCVGRSAGDAHVRSGTRALALVAVALAGAVTLMLWIGLGRTALASGGTGRRTGVMRSSPDGAAAML
jgi:hypothetical protein